MTRRGRAGTLEETALIDQACRGDTTAYTTLVERHQELAFRAAYLITGDAAEAQDAAQEAFVKAYYALSRFRPGAPFRPWLLRIVTNEARNRRVAARRRASLTERVAGDNPAAATDPSPEAATLAAERRASLLRALDELREDDRVVIAYRYFADLSEAEMAGALGLARGTVKSRLSRALGRLRQRLLGEEGRDG